MKNLKAPIAGILIFIAAAGCRKHDVQDVQTEENSPNTVSIAAPAEGIVESGWEQGSEWTAVEQPSHSVFYTNIMAAAISDESADQGLVRVFKTSATGGTSSRSLPFEETVNGNKYYWYYQVTKGNVMIAVDVYGTKDNPADKSLFKYMVVEKSAVADFENKGTSRADLMDMSYEKMTDANNR